MFKEDIYTWRKASGFAFDETSAIHFPNPSLIVSPWLILVKREIYEKLSGVEMNMFISNYYIYICISYHIEIYMLADVQAPEIVIELLENLPALTVRSRPSYTHRLTTKKSHWQIKMVWQKKCINQLCCWQLIFVYYTVVYIYYADVF